MNEGSLPPAAAEDWAAHYEQLRKDVLSQGFGSGFGLSILLCQGMSAWIRACICVLPVPVTAGKFSQSWIAITPLPDDVRSQAAVILAGMLLAHPQETTL